MKNPCVVLAFVFSCFFVTTGCHTAVSYKPTGISGSTFPPKSAQEYIPVYLENMVIPRQSEIIGTVRVGDTGFTAIGGSKEEVIKTIQDMAREKGADAVQITSIKPPDLISTIWRMKANLIRYGNWETVDINESEFIKYLESKKSEIDPIEGIWVDSEQVYRIAIKKDSTKTSRDFVGVILDVGDRAGNQGWKKNYKKIDIISAAQRGVYILKYFAGGFSEHGSTVAVGKTSTFSVDLKFLNRPPEKVVFVKTFPKGELVEIEGNRKVVSSGSGFLFDRSGLVASNWHVIGNGSKIKVVFPEKGKEFVGKIKVRDKQNDLVIIQLEDFDYKTVFGSSKIPPIGSAKSVKIGDKVFTLGIPLSSLLGGSIKYSNGTLSSLFGINEDPRLYQISVPIQPGNSGGPLLTEDGRIVGIIVSTLNPLSVFSRNKVLPQNVNFAIKSDYLSNLANVSGITLNKEDKRDVGSAGAIGAVKPFIARIIVE